MLTNKFDHKPVLLNEILEALNCSEGKVFLDCTTGGGGHSSEILGSIGKTGFLYCLDRDLNAINASEKVLNKIGNNYKLIKDSYVNLETIISENNIPLLDGILFDLGVSSPQLDHAERGFSFSKEAPLDMRFAQDENLTLTAADLVRNLSKEELTKIFSEYGEEPYSKTIAEAIVNHRRKETISTTTQLSSVIIRALDGKKFKGNVHPATRVFQALRIKVNEELKGIEEVLPLAMKFLKTGGRLAVISFHSLEDRIVKEAFRETVKTCVCPPRQPVCTCNKVAVGTIITKKPVIANAEELKSNPRARSAKLRVVEKIDVQ
jgi:16S rRNA (cytosine1402-N4)-methyltransferase